MPSISQRIAAFSSDLDFEQIPGEVIEKAKVSLLHNLGMAMAAGSLAGSAIRYAEALGEQGPTASARLLLSGRKATPETAAFANAALIHARAQDDVYFPGFNHVGAMVTPAALGVGEQLASSGRDLLTALVAGYEAAAAISQGFAKRTTARGFRASGIYGGFGAAVAVARLLRLDREATANAIGIVAGMAAGTNQTWVAGTQEWQFHVGLASRNGILAARLAAVGGTGAPDALEGQAGFYAAFMGDVDQVDRVGRDLGTTWRGLDVTYKRYAVCAILQVPVLEAIALAQQHDLKPDDISAVRLTLNPAEAAYPGTDSTGPFRDTGATLMSAQFCLAVALNERRVKGTDLQRFADRSIQSLVERTQVRIDDRLDARSFDLEIDLVGGRTLRHSSRATVEPFNWNRAQVIDNLRSMGDELPMNAVDLNRFAETVLSAERKSVEEIVSACVLTA